MSRPTGSFGRNPFHLPALSPGTLGCRDAADPSSVGILGFTPGPLGRNDCADPDAKPTYGFGIGHLHLTLSPDKDLLFWDYDPRKLLEDERLNPEFVEESHGALRTAVRMGLRPRVHQAYRSAEESDALYKKYKAHTGARAAPAWQSVHNYGMAMDVWLYDAKGRYIDNKVRGWFKLYKQLAKAASAFLWGAPFDDADHFEYHPNWDKPAKGKHLLNVRKWAMRAAMAHGKKVEFDARADDRPDQAADFIPEQDIQWMPYFWWAAGANPDEQPNQAFLAKDKVPIQA